MPARRTLVREQSLLVRAGRNVKNGHSHLKIEPGSLKIEQRNPMHELRDLVCIRRNTVIEPENLGNVGKTNRTAQTAIQNVRG